MEALFLMAKLYEEGYSVDVNQDLAQSYYEKAASLGLYKGFTKIAHYQYSIKRNIPKAIELYEKAL